MKVEKYYLKSDETLTVSEFISEGPKGAIRKLIRFQTTSQRDLRSCYKNRETGNPTFFIYTSSNIYTFDV